MVGNVISYSSYLNHAIVSTGGRGVLCVNDDTVVVLCYVDNKDIIILTPQYTVSLARPGLQCRLESRRERERERWLQLVPASPPVRLPLGGRGLALQGQVSVLGEGPG